jgi:DivIVA domain-containing protein
VTSGQNEADLAPAMPERTPVQPERRLSPADLQHVRFTRASMMRPGYVETEVDRVMHRLAEELGRLISEKSELRDQVRSLQSQVEGHQAVAPPSEQAVRILASAQLTADNYVAEAEEFSRQVTSEARTQYEEVTREARETAGAIIQAAQEAAAKMAPVPVQLRSYLEALLTDVEKEWGRADPAALPQGAAAAPPPAQRSGRNNADRSATFDSNSVTTSTAEVDDDVVQVVAVRE